MQSSQINYNLMHEKSLSKDKHAHISTLNSNHIYREYLKHQRQKNKTIYHRDIPYVNFYQYPTPKKVNPQVKQSLLKKLCLNNEMPDPPVFTIFVSIPYCRSHCNSCIFFKAFLPRKEDQFSILGNYLNSAFTQIKMYGLTRRFSSAHCDAVYIGGGTPSLLASNQVSQIIKNIKTSFSMGKHVEITLEGNPQDMSQNYLNEIKNAGINRISIGFQSSQHNILKQKIGSPHNEFMSIEALKNAIDAGFETVNVDLLYGIPGQSFEDWKFDLKTVYEFQPESITIYPYVIHSNSSAERMINCGNLEKPPDSDTIHTWYLWSVNKLKKLGYIEQRKGNFFKPYHEQMYAKLTYMQTVELVGIGAGAYSFINRYFFKTSNNPKLFQKYIHNNSFLKGDYQSTKASGKEIMIRYIMHNIILLSRNDFYNRFGNDPVIVFPQIYNKLQKYKLTICTEKKIKLTNTGKRWISNILYEFYSEGLKIKQYCIN